MYLPRSVWMIFIVLGGICWIYIKFIAAPGFQEKEHQYISQGLAKEREAYLMRQVHTYYFIKPISMDEILTHIDMAFLEKQVDLLRNAVVKNMVVRVSDNRLILETSTLMTKFGFQAIFEQLSDGTETTYQTIVSHCEGGAAVESAYRLTYNVFLTHIEEVLNRIDNAVEVERKLMK